MTSPFREIIIASLLLVAGYWLLSPGIPPKIKAPNRFQSS
jgi:hypothetical protein